MNIGGRDGHEVNESFARHAVIAERIIVRHVALVTPEEVYAIPGSPKAESFRVGPEDVQLHGRMSSR